MACAIRVRNKHENNSTAKPSNQMNIYEFVTDGPSEKLPVNRAIEAAAGQQLSASEVSRDWNVDLRLTGQQN